jgi:hypothetical protein
VNESTGGGGTCTGSARSGQDPRKIPNPICNSAASGLILFGTARLRRTLNAACVAGLQLASNALINPGNGGRVMARRHWPLITIEERSGGA